MTLVCREGLREPARAELAAAEEALQAAAAVERILAARAARVAVAVERVARPMTTLRLRFQAARAAVEETVRRVVMEAVISR